jgi:CRP-like cAMP-binding protein
MPKSLSLPRRRVPRVRAIQGPNLLLATLPPKAYAAIEPALVPVRLESGQVLQASLEPIANVYFPDSAVLSLITRLSDGRAVEVGTVGNEGFAGLSLLLGVDASATECVAQVPGKARLLSARAFRRAVNGGGSLHTVLMRYVHLFMHQAAQRTACNAFHPVSARCARWLLAADDTAGGNGDGSGFLLTQEYLAYMLGVRREGVSAAARSLREEDLIRFSRGRIMVIDRDGLEAAACDCYQAMSDEYERVLGNRPSNGELAAG